MIITSGATSVPAALASAVRSTTASCVRVAGAVGDAVRPGAADGLPGGVCGATDHKNFAMSTGGRRGAIVPAMAAGGAAVSNLRRGGGGAGGGIGEGEKFDAGPAGGCMEEVAWVTGPQGEPAGEPLGSGPAGGCVRGTAPPTGPSVGLAGALSPPP